MLNATKVDYFEMNMNLHVCLIDGSEFLKAFVHYVKGQLGLGSRFFVYYACFKISEATRKNNNEKSKNLMHDNFWT